MSTNEESRLYEEQVHCLEVWKSSVQSLQVSSSLLQVNMYYYYFFITIIITILLWYLMCNTVLPYL